MRFHNSLTRQLERFEPLEQGHVRMYTCGPTVYDYAHIGNFRAYVFEDLLRRYLKYRGYRVTQVMNLTDVDDKTIKGSRAAGVPLDEFTAVYKQAFFEDLDVLNIERAEHYPEATGHIPEMMELIRRLFENGYAYQSDDGSVYFGISKFADYGKLAHLDRSGLRAGVRVAQDEYDKDNVADFALWKAWTEDDGDVRWSSEWGDGRPGWHIECSAMSMKYLGESLDIHTGGIDNLFPHHENEIAQSEGATGKPFVKTWMHCEHLIVEGRKMSKSLGNFHTLRDIRERGYSGREIRYVLIGAHYRQQLNFTFDALDSARSALERLDDFRERLAGCGGADGHNGRVPDWVRTAREKFEASLDDDLGISGAVAAVFDMVHDGNRAMDSGRLDCAPAVVTGVLDDFDRVLGFLSPAHEEADEEVVRLVDRREQARAARDWGQSDKLRDEIRRLGWEVRDTPDGPKLRKRQA
jgi:cysteinyl-tRNA synthetase